MSSEPPGIKLASGIGLVILVLTAISVLGIAIDVVLRLPRLPTEHGRPAGIGLIVIGIALEALSIRALWYHGKGTPNPRDPPRRLVTVGPYRFSRNPLYVARLATLLGLSLFFSSVGILTLSILLFVGLHLVVLPREEERLEGRFGRSYIDYKSKVPRWIPLRPWGRSHNENGRSRRVR